MQTATYSEARNAVLALGTNMSSEATPSSLAMDLSIDDLREMVSKLAAELRLAQKGLGYQARLDPLTGVWNRSATLDTLRRELARSDRQNMPFAVIACAVDNFKKINGDLGDIAGDSVLRAVARRIMPAVRPYDSVGRISGNKFLILAPGCDKAGASSMAERIHRIFKDEATDVTEVFCEEVIDEPEEHRLSVTVSVGAFAVEQARNPERLLKGAKESLRAAQRAGGDRVMMSSLPIA